MKKYIPIDFDEKGNAVLGNAKSNPTSNGFIPTAWAPGGSDEGKNGIKSITISPSISTTPALESAFPIYWNEERADSDGWMELNPSFHTDAPLHIGEEYTFTITPTPDWHFNIGGTEYAAGEPVSVTVTAASEGALNPIEYGVSNDDGTKGIYGIISLVHQ